MATAICPAGHTSTAQDYCDVCGLPVTEAPPPAPAPPPSTPSVPAAPAAPTEATCPHCGAVNPPDPLFCEACGYDFTTGTPPRSAPAADPLGQEPAPPAPAPAAAPPATPGDLAPPLRSTWVAEVWIDPDWYADQESTDPLPSAGVPSVVVLRSTSALVGRASRSRGIHPDVDLGSDNGISRRHAQLTSDGTRWWVEDLGSSNGTYLGTAVGALPKDPIPPGERREVPPDGRIYLGAWTRLVIRRAQPGEA